MKFRPIAALLAALVLFASSVPAVASEVMLKNGDRVSGRIVQRTDKQVVIETDYAGPVTIDASHIDKILDEEPLAGADLAEAAPDEPINKATPPPPLKPVPRLIGDGPLYGLANGWDGNANVGLSYTSGNSQTTTMTTGIQAVKTGGRDKLTIYARSLWNSNRNSGSHITTQNAVWGGLRYDRNLNDRVFGFVSYDFERDRPKRLNFRSVAGGGLGHQTIKTERTELEFLVGGAWNRSWQQSGPNTDTPEALAGNTLKHKFHDRLKIRQTLTYSQNITDRNEFRFIFDTTLSADVTKRIGWYVTIGDRFNNDPVGNSKQNDFLFTTGMRWNFGRKK